MLLSLLFLGLSGCNKENKAAQSLANVGSKTATSLANYYKSLAEDTEQEPVLEIFYERINRRPEQFGSQASFGTENQKIFEQRVLFLRHREQMAQSLASFYDALQKLSSYNASTDLNKSVDNLTASLNQISAEPTSTTPSTSTSATASTSKLSLSNILKPVINGLVELKQTHSIDRGIKTIQLTLKGIKELLDKETIDYNIITDRYYTLLIGSRTNTLDQLCTPNQVKPKGTEGIAEYLIKTQSMNLQFLLQQIPELQGLPWNPQAVKDPATKCAMGQYLNVTLATLKMKSQTTPATLSKSLQELINQHEKFLQKQPLTLTDVLADQEQAQIYIELLKKLRTQKNTQ